MSALKMVRREEESRQEKMAKMIEDRVAQIPSDAFLWAAGLSILGSLAMKVTQRDENALFIGQWAPTLLILGLYSKFTKRLMR
ncbi:MAG: hypothetical protein R2940_00010 [Syntrophotaleaceae bacterium]